MGFLCLDAYPVLISFFYFFPICVNQKTHASMSSSKTLLVGANAPEHIDLIPQLDNRQKRLYTLLDTLHRLYGIVKRSYDALHPIPFDSGVINQSVAFMATLLVPLAQRTSVPIRMLSSQSTITDPSVDDADETRSRGGDSNQSSSTIFSYQSDLISVPLSVRVIARLDPNKTDDKELIALIQAWQRGGSSVLSDPENIKLLRRYPSRMGKVNDYRRLFRGVSKFERDLVKAFDYESYAPRVVEIKYDRPTSWTLSASAAIHFAQTPIPGQAIVEAANDSDEEVDEDDDGAIGYVLVLEMSSNEIPTRVLFDIGRTHIVNDADDGDQKDHIYAEEREVLLEAGSYTVTIRKVGKDGVFDTDDDVSSVASDTSAGNTSTSDMSRVGATQQTIATITPTSSAPATSSIEQELKHGPPERYAPLSQDNLFSFIANCKSVTELEEIEDLIKVKGLDWLNERDPKRHGWAHVHYAAANKHAQGHYSLELTKLLYEYGANMSELTYDSRNDVPSGSTCLHVAIHKGKVETVKYLLDNSEESFIRFPNQNNTTPYMLAKTMGGKKVVRQAMIDAFLKKIPTLASES
jgi:hypothetical protein